MGSSTPAKGSCGLSSVSVSRRFAITLICLILEELDHRCNLLSYFLQRKIQVVHPPSPLHGEEEAAAVEAAEDLAAQELGGAGLLAVGAEDDVAGAQAPLGGHGAVRHLADGEAPARRLHPQAHRALQHLETQPLGWMRRFQGQLERPLAP